MTDSIGRGDEEQNAADVGKLSPRPAQDCTNPHCMDGYVDKERGTQDGRYSWVDQVPCQICNAPERETETSAKR